MQADSDCLEDADAMRASGHTVRFPPGPYPGSIRSLQEFHLINLLGKHGPPKDLSAALSSLLLS